MRYIIDYYDDPKAANIAEVRTVTVWGPMIPADIHFCPSYDSVRIGFIHSVVSIGVVVHVTQATLSEVASLDPLEDFGSNF